MIRKRYERVVSAVGGWGSGRWNGVRSAVGGVRGVGLATALRGSVREGYSWRTFREDALAGSVMSLVSLPPSLALSVATGLRPEVGLYTSVVAGFVAALLGGSRFQVTGPTAAFVVILAPIASVYGHAGVAVTTALAGLILFAMGVLRLGRLIQFIPYPVTTGLLAGIAVIVATLGVKDFLGLSRLPMPEHYWEKISVIADGFRLKFLAQPFSVLMLSDVLIATLTLGVLLWLPKLTRRVPAPLVALPLATLVAWGLTKTVPGFSVQTIMSVFGTASAPAGIPHSAPLPSWPWNLPGPIVGGIAVPMTGTMDTVRALLAAALALAVLGAMESLLAGVVTDGITGTRHDPDGELAGQGVGNLAASLFGGMAASGALARTLTNVKSGARSPIAAMVHALLILLFMLLLTRALGHLPMGAIAAMLIINARNLLQVRQLLFVLRFAPRADVAVMATCFILTVVFDMVLSVAVGLVLAAGLFVKQMSEMTTVKLIDNGLSSHPPHPKLDRPVPEGVLVYDIGGPLFFGAANRAFASMEIVGQKGGVGGGVAGGAGGGGGGGGVRAVVLDLEDVSTIDASGLVSLDALIVQLNERRVMVVLASVPEQPMDVMMRAGWLKGQPLLAVAASVSAAVGLAEAWVRKCGHPHAEVGSLKG